MLAFRLNVIMDFGGSIGKHNKESRIAPFSLKAKDKRNANLEILHRESKANVLFSFAAFGSIFSTTLSKHVS